MCIQVATLDNWSILARSLFKDDGTIDLDVAAFFLSFIVVVVFVLLPVVAAVYTDYHIHRSFASMRPCSSS